MELTINYSYVDQIIPPRCRKPRPQLAWFAGNASRPTGYFTRCDA